MNCCNDRERGFRKGVALLITEMNIMPHVFTIEADRKSMLHTSDTAIVDAWLDEHSAEHRELFVQEYDSDSQWVRGFYSARYPLKWWLGRSGYTGSKRIRCLR